MTTIRRASMRRLWANIHLWLGLALGFAGALLGISGSVLVFDGKIDSWLNPRRYAVSGNEIALPYSAYLEAAAKVVGVARPAEEGRTVGGQEARAVGVQLPADSGPVVVTMRSRDVPGVSRVYIDPPTGRALDVARGGGFVAWMHQFHGSLMLREFRGREFIGIVGVAMLASALSGIYLWWPGRARVRRSLGFREGFRISRNLHYSFGFYASLVLAVISFTGAYLAFPDAGRRIVAMFSPISLTLRGGQPPGPTSKAGTSTTPPVVTPDRAVEIARAFNPESRLAGIGLPGVPGTPYRITMREARDPHTEHGGNTVVLIDPLTGAVERRVDASTRTAGDTVLAWLSPLHSGEAFGLASRVVYFVVGFVPPLLYVTGFLMWLRQRREHKRAAVRREGSLTSEAIAS